MMVELFTHEFVSGVLGQHFRRCDAARAIGVSMQAAVEGAEIPDGWTLDPETEYFLPPNVVLI